MRKWFFMDQRKPDKNLVRVSTAQQVPTSQYAYHSSLINWLCLTFEKRDTVKKNLINWYVSVKKVDLDHMVDIGWIERIQGKHDEYRITDTGKVVVQTVKAVETQAVKENKEKAS